jgi:o-succinylbenzoate synthase
MYKANYIKHALNFHVPAGTSRGVLNEKESWFIFLTDSDHPAKTGIGECSIIPGLSIDKRSDLEEKLEQSCEQINSGAHPGEIQVKDFPAINFGLETAFIDHMSGEDRVLFETNFTNGKVGIPINGLIWMGDKRSMLDQVETKINDGFRILKFKVGAIDFNVELEILKSVRSSFSKSDLEIRLDANGAWDANEAIEKLNRLSTFGIHSIEQPIASGQMEAMRMISEQSPIDIALDEELIGASGAQEMQHILSFINPAYIILKPSLLGGIKASEKWIRMAEKLKIGWWITSALESNIGLNAIAQWAATLNTILPQGLGTGQLFTNNFPSPLTIESNKLWYNPESKWDISKLINS